MITLMTYDRDKEEQQMLLYDSENVVAYYSDEKLDKITFENQEEARAYIEKSGLLDAAFMEITDEEEIQLTKDFRKSYQETELMLISDASISPMRYVTPDVKATSLLLRPFKKEEGEQVVRDFFTALFRERNRADQNKRLIIENREGKLSIPFSKIYHVEVKAKKLYIRLKNEEYSKYGSLDGIEKELPEHFLRCHRSYIVNENYISQIKLTENVIVLQDGMRIPISRTYKPMIKSYVERKRWIWG